MSRAKKLLWIRDNIYQVYLALSTMVGLNFQTYKDPVPDRDSIAGNHIVLDALCGFLLL